MWWSRTVYHKKSCKQSIACDNSIICWASHRSVWRARLHDTRWYVTLNMARRRLLNSYLFTCPDILFKLCYTHFDQFVRESKILVTEWPSNLNVSHGDVAYCWQWSTGSHNSSSQAARTLAGSLFIESVDVENIILKFNKKEVRNDGNWDALVKFLKSEREADKNTVRVFTVDVEKRE